MDNKNELNENTDVIETEEILDDKNDPVKPEPEYVTREINLDDLYDGSVNNTIVIDPITNKEVLLKNKKPNYTLLGIFLAVLALLVLYYVNNKSDFGTTTKDVEPKTTTTTKAKVIEENISGVLTCTYSIKSDAESQNITYIADYENEKLLNSKFNYVVVSNTENVSVIVEDLKTQYENFFINNATIKGNNVSYEKDDKGFTFNVETDYLKEGYDGLVITENQTILFVKPSNIDTVESMQKAYADKGFICSLTNNKEEK